jgi:hypothetical protein
MGNGLNSGVYALAVYDPDGDGPLPARLIAGGIFTRSGATVVGHVAQWDGGAWTTLGGGVSSNPAGETVRALCVYDADGSGPLPSKLIAGGDLPNWTISSGIVQWDGASWSAFMSGYYKQVHSMTVFDRDGAGPAAPVLVIGSYPPPAGTPISNRLDTWNGSTWGPLSGDVLGTVDAITVYDADGNGSGRGQLVAAGSFNSIGGFAVGYIAQYGCAGDGVVVGCGDADLGGAGGLVGPDGVLDNNDFIAFINLFFASDSAADQGSAGGVPGHDGALDNNDFIAFINLFFVGC